MSTLKQLQEDQNIAVSKEDFASAENINHEIEKTNSELERLKFMHPIFDEKVLFTLFVVSCYVDDSVAVANSIIIKGLRMILMWQCDWCFDIDRPDAFR